MALYQSTDINGSWNFTSGVGAGFSFNSNVRASGITYTVISGLASNISVNFSCFASNIQGYTDIVTGATSYNIYTPYNASTPTFTWSGIGPTQSSTSAIEILLLVGTVRITASGQQYSLSNNNVSATATFDISFNLTEVSLLNDFVFVDTTSTAHPPKNILFLPQLPGSQTSNSKLLFIKDKSNNASVNNIIISPPIGTSIENIQTTPITLSANTSCLTLFNNGVGYFIANNYPSNNQQILPSNSSSSAVTNGYPMANSINIFDTSTFGRVSTNRVSLPDNREPAFCIVVYSGTAAAGARTPPNTLVFQAAYNQTIDNVPSFNPALSVDSSNKSCGIVFISDGSGGWFIAGYYNSQGWDWSVTTGGGNLITQSSSYDIKLIDANVATRFYVLPFSPSSPYLSIIKTQSLLSGGQGIRYHSFLGGMSAFQYINDSSVAMFYTGNQTNNCVWFVAESTRGGVLRYHPILGYTP